MKLRLFILSILASISWTFGQGVNMSLVSHIDYQALHAANLNNVWGYVDETGIEYALVGTTKGTSVVSLADPQNPTEVFWVAGSESIWRELKVFQDVAYVTTEADDGLLIIDLSPLPQSNTLATSFYFGDIFGQYWTSAHNIHIDTQGGYAYICGANRGNGGMIILDLNQNPLSPAEVGTFDNWYCHDAFAQGNLLYGAHISDGFFSIIDITDHSNPVLLNTQMTPNSFSHNIWLTSDGNFAVTTDEVQGAYLTLYDVNNPLSISETDRIQSTPGANIIPHNAYILHDSLIVSSYYTDGVTIHNMKRPNNLVEVGSYDTNPLSNGSFNGAWGVYPFLPSGLILASDITLGLFVLNANTSAASYFEGHVRNASNGLALNGVSVTIQNDPETDLSNLSGDFAVGTSVSGTKNVTFYKVAFEPLTIQVPFQNGEVVIDTIDLIPLAPFNVTVHVQDAQTGLPIINSNVRITVPQMELETQTDGFGDAVFTAYYEANSFLNVGVWGYVSKCQYTQIDNTTGTILVELNKGYYDDFSFDFGWIVTNVGATSGVWERGVSNWTGTPANPQFDVEYDCSDMAYVTGNAQTFDSDHDDVDNGKVILRSPIFDLSTYSDPFVNFHTWFYNNYGPQLIDDSLVVSLSNGTANQTLVVLAGNGDQASWNAHSLRVSDFMTPTNQMRLTVTTADYNPNINITEAAFDWFSVSETNVLDVKSKTKLNEWSLFPNPAKEAIKIEGNTSKQVRIYTMFGNLCFDGILSETNELNVSHLSNGMYILEIDAVRKRFIKD